MHGCRSAIVILVNAKVDSMGGVGIGSKTSPLRAEIEKVQSELRQEYQVRDERRRELEYLEKGGNPLDFKLGNVASVSVQSTSLRNQHPDQFVTSEAKGSFAFIASPHGDSVESSGRPGAFPGEPNSADNIMLLDSKNEFSEGDQNSSHPGKSNVAPSEKSSQLGGSQNVKEFGDSDAFGLARKAYKRRYRSRPSNDRIKSSSTDVVPTRGCHGSSLPPLRGLRDVKEQVPDPENCNDQNASSNCHSKPTSPPISTLHMTGPSISQRDMELDSVRVVKSTKDSINHGSPNAASGTNTSKTPPDNQHIQQSVSEAEKSPVQMASNGPEPVQSREEVNSAVIESQPHVTPMKVENPSSSCHMNGLSSGMKDQIKNDGQNSSTERGTKGLDSESSCTQTTIAVDGNNEGETCTNTRNVDSNGSINNQASVLVGVPIAEGDELVGENKETKANENGTSVNAKSNSAQQNHQENGPVLEGQEELHRSIPALQNEAKDQVIIEALEAGGPSEPVSERKSSNIPPNNRDPASVSRQNSIDSSIPNLPKASLMARISTVASEAQNLSVPNLKLASKVDEESILEEAQIIEAKQKRIKELSTATSPPEIRRKSNWDYVLEEMAWLANDFAQERLWKITAAAQICRKITFTSQLRKQEKTSHLNVKKIAHSLATAVMEFWHSVEETTCKDLELESSKESALAVKAYAVNFLKYNHSDSVLSHAEAPLTPDRMSDSGILDMSWEDHLTEENLFYTVPPEAVASYRRSIEYHVAQYEKTGSNVQDEVDTSACDNVADNAYEEDEGETSTYDMSVAFEGKSSRFAQKNVKHLTNAYGARSYKTGSHLLPVQCIESKVAIQQSALLAKRPGSNLNVSIPTKRMRTASRRVISPFSAGTSGAVQISNKTDASSGDTDSYQDDQSTLRGGSLVPNSLEAESVDEFDKELQFESVQTLTKPNKKKKKEKHLNATYEQRWHVDSNFQSEQFQWDHLKKRSECHQVESNSSSGLFGQHIMKKPKIMRQQDNSFDTHISGSVPSPAASQISNMPQPNKFVRMLGGRDRGRKPKALKMPAGQLGSGNQWSLSEDQALVVLVHDLGPNWELVSDAINSTLKFKCIFRKPKECKERHNILMDRTSGDGEDGIEYSGSSQPYPSALPGIPKGRASQLFQCLQGPMEEDTIKSHFEKIIVIGVKQHYRKTQDQKREPAHDSHSIALSQVCPSNLNGGPILTPLDLCDATTSSPDVHSLGVPHSSGLAIASQATVSPMLPASGAGSAAQGSATIMPGNNSSVPPGPVGSSVRDGRYGIPRSTSLSMDEQQRIQQYNQIISGRNIQQPSMSASGAFPGNDRGVRMLTGNTGMGMVSGVNRNMPILRPGFQGLASSSMANSGSMVSPGSVSVNMQSGVGPGQGNSVFRPRDTLHMMRPGMSQDSQRQMMVPDLQMQASPGSSQGVSPFGGKNSPFPNQTSSQPVSSFPVHHQQPRPISPQQPQVLGSHLQGAANHPPHPQQQAYAIRLAKERQMHRFLQHQQHQFTSNSLIQHAQQQPQPPISPPSQNNSQTSSPSVSHPPLTSASMNSMLPHQQKHQMHNAQTVSGVSQTGKQRQRLQHVLHGNRSHPQQRQQSQGQQQAKLSRGVGRGNLMHQNMQVDSSHLDAMSMNTGSQASEKADSTTHVVQGQGSYPGPPPNTVRPVRQYVPSQSSNKTLPQQKTHSGQVFSSAKHPPQMPSHSDNSSEGQVPPVAPAPAPTSSAGHQSGPTVTVTAPNHHKSSHQQKFVNQNPQSLQRGFQQNRKPNSGPPNKPQTGNTEQHATSSSEMGHMRTLPQVCSNATNAAQVISPPSAQPNGSEPLFDSDTTNSSTNLGTSVPPQASSNDSVTQNSQGPGQRLSSTGLPKIGHDVTSQWQQQPSQLQPPPSPVPQPQEQQPQPLQAGNGNLYGRPTDPRPE